MREPVDAFGVEFAEEVHQVDISNMRVPIAAAVGLVG
jgi:hypothetical protein